MIGRLLILIAMMLTGPLFIEVYLYHPFIVIEHDKAAMIPMVASPLMLFGGFLLMAAEGRLTQVVFALACTVSVATGVVGTAIHVALHTASLLSLVTNPDVWLGEPPILVPLSFAAAGCLGFIPLLMPTPSAPQESPPAIARLLQGFAALCGLAATIAGALVDGGTVALFAVVAALGLGAFGYVAELIVFAVPLVRPYLPHRSA